MHFDFLLIWPDTSICWINCNPVDKLSDNISCQKINVSLALDLLLELCETTLELLGGLTLCMNSLLRFF